MPTTIQYLSSNKRKEIALETKEIFVPLAHRLGMAKLKWQLEDLSLKIYDDFTIIVTKYVNCDDGSKGCAYFFYAYQSKLLEKYFYSIGYNVWKDSTRAGLTISPTDIDYYEAGQNVGACFFKEDNKFCFEFKE